MSRALAVAALAALALGASACSQKNAYLELDLRFPPDPSAVRSAVVGVVTGDVSFDEDWKSTEPLPAVALDAKAQKSLAVSVEGRPEIETTPVRVKVRFCRDPSCAGIADDRAPEVRFEIERAFYLGERTSVTLAVDCIPNVTGDTNPLPKCATVDKAIVAVPKCSVAGCREGVTRSYCANGKHFCEP